MGGGAAAEEPASSSFFTAFCVCGRDDEVLKPPPVHDESVAVVENDLDVPGAEDVVELDAPPPSEGPPSEGPPSEGPPSETTPTKASGVAETNDQVLDPEPFSSPFDPPPCEPSVSPIAAKNDEVFEDFKKKLLAGIPLIKHCKDRQARKRIIYLDTTLTKIGWYEAGKTTRKQTPLTSISEVRKATDVDPSSTSLSGTPILRGSMHVAYKNMAFSLILKSRSLDLQCDSEAQCQTLVSCFKRLILA